MYNSNKQYNTRHSGRYTNMSNFVPGSEQQQQPPTPARPAPAPAQAQNQQNLQPVQMQESYLSHEDVEMKVDMKVEPQTDAPPADPVRPHWMKSKLPGVKKVPTRERRRRQNETLRRLITPKNALMVLNEMLTNEQVNNQFKVEPTAVSPFYKAANTNSFCAELALNGKNYRGYGETKMASRNAAAEQAIRDLIIQRMEKLAAAPSAAPSAAPPAANALLSADLDQAGGVGPEEPALPMIQLASFALHKLFSEWEYDGHKIPCAALRPAGLQAAQSGSESGTESSPAAPLPPLPPAARKAPRVLPSNAPQLHPCMLLAYMKNKVEYKELAVQGDSPQNMSFTYGVDVENTTYIGKASNKKEARRQAAKAACEALFKVQFDEKPSSNTPVHQ